MASCEQEETVRHCMELRKAIPLEIIDSEFGCPGTTHASSGKRKYSECFKKDEQPGTVLKKVQQSLKNQSETILKLLRTFCVGGFEATNCIFKKNAVEVRYVVEDSSVAINNEVLRQRLAAHLEIEAAVLKLTKLRSRPVFKLTTFRPGDIISNNVGSQCCLGAFVNVEGIGVHALMCGHEKNAGDSFHNQSGDVLETVVALDEDRLPPRPSTNEGAVFRDIALARLMPPTDHISTVVSNNGTTLHLNEDPKEAEDDMEVSLFTNNGRRGNIDSTAYHHLGSLNVNHRMISVKDEQGGPIHNDGESGILIVTNDGNAPGGGAAVESKVDAVGMLVVTEKWEQEDEEGPRVISLAAPLISGFKALKSHPYCNGAEIKFC